MDTEAGGGSCGGGGGGSCAGVSSNSAEAKVGVFEGVGGVSPLVFSKVCNGLAVDAVPVAVEELEASV